VQYLLFYAEIIDKNRKNRAYADLGHISALQLHGPKRDRNISSVLAPEKILPLLLLSVLMGHLYHLLSSSKVLHIKQVGEITTLSKLCEFFVK